jgi:hypothetical protein
MHGDSILFRALSALKYHVGRVHSSLFYARESSRICPKFEGKSQMFGPTVAVEIGPEQWFTSVSFSWGGRERADPPYWAVGG